MAGFILPILASLAPGIIGTVGNIADAALSAIIGNSSSKKGYEDFKSTVRPLFNSLTGSIPTITNASSNVVNRLPVSIPKF